MSTSETHAPDLAFDPSPRLVNPDWAEEKCIHCSLSDYNEEQGIHPRTIVICSSCGISVSHVECHQKACGAGSDDVSFAEEDGDWFCSRGCQHVYQSMKQAIGAKIECQEKSINIEWTRYNPNSDARTANTSVDAAFNIFRSAFGRMDCNGRDLIKLVTYSTEDPDDYGEGAVDYSSFFVVVLRKGSVVVSAAVMRVRGQSFAELPFISTKEGHRGQGNCRRLVSSVERRMISLGVKHLLIPSLSSAMGMWSKFGYQPLSHQELEDLGDSILQMDPESSKFLKKRLDFAIPQESQKRPAAAMTSRSIPTKKANRKHGSGGKRGRGGDRVSLGLELDDDEKGGEGSGSGSESDSSEEKDEEEEEEEEERGRKRPRVHVNASASRKAPPIQSHEVSQGRGGGSGSRVSLALTRSRPPPLMKNNSKKPPKVPSKALPRTSSLVYFKPSPPPSSSTTSACSLPLYSDLILDIEEWLLCSGFHTDEYKDEYEDEDKEGGEGGGSIVAYDSPLSPIQFSSFQAPSSIKKVIKSSHLLAMVDQERTQEGTQELFISPTKHVPSLLLSCPPHHAPHHHQTVTSTAPPMEIIRFKAEVLDSLLPMVVHCLFTTPSPDASMPLHSMDSSPDKGQLLTSPAPMLLGEDEPVPMSIEESMAVAAQYAYSLED